MIKSEQPSKDWDVPQALKDIGITKQMIIDCWTGYAEGKDIWDLNDSKGGKECAKV